MRTQKPQPLPIDDEKVAAICDDIATLNRSERRKVHQHILIISKEASDKLMTNNATLIGVRLDQTSYDRLLNIVEDTNSTISEVARRVLVREIHKEMKNAERRYA